MTDEISDRQFQGFKRNPMSQINSVAIKNLTKHGSELGLSPKSRSELIELNMQATNEKSTKDKMNAFFDGGDYDY